MTLNLTERVNPMNLPTPVVAALIQTALKFFGTPKVELRNVAVTVNHETNEPTCVEFETVTHYSNPQLQITDLWRIKVEKQGQFID